MLVLAITLLLGALVLSDAARARPMIGYWRGRAAEARLALHVLPLAQFGEAADNDSGRFRFMDKIVSYLDPSSSTTQEALAGIGIADERTRLLAKYGKLIIALLVAYVLYAAFKGGPLGLAASFLAYLLAQLLCARALKSFAVGRRRRILSELILGTELLMVFLEGGQSLDQALRSLSDVCDDALPRLSPIQKALVEDLNNGVPYEKALYRWAENLGLEQARLLGIMFNESLNHGTELAPQLRQLSDDFLEQRFTMARASIGSKSACLTVVMILFFLPAILAFVSAPALIALFKGLE